MRFDVAVITVTNSLSEVEELLAPYNEQDEEFFEFTPSDTLTLQEVRAEYAKLSPKEKRDYNDYPSWLACEHGMVECDGQVGYFENPNAHYDYYSVKIAPSHIVPKAFRPNAELAKKAATFWDEYVEGGDRKKQEVLAENQHKFLYHPQFYRNEYRTKSTYVNYMSHPHLPYAIVLPGGSYRSRHQYMNADDFICEWEMSIAENQGRYITFVNCHI